MITTLASGPSSLNKTGSDAPPANTPGTAQKTTVSVIINVFNEAKTIEREIREIHAEIIQKLPGSELIVAEDGSTDGTKEILARLKSELGIIHSTSPSERVTPRRSATPWRWRKILMSFSATPAENRISRNSGSSTRTATNTASSADAERPRDQLYRRLMTLAYNFLLRLYSTSVSATPTRVSASTRLGHPQNRQRNLGKPPSHFLGTCPAGHLQRLRGQGSAGALPSARRRIARAAAGENPQGHRQRV